MSISPASLALRRWWDLPRRRTGPAWERRDPVVDDRRPPTARKPAPAPLTASRAAPRARRTWRRVRGVAGGVVGVVFLGDLAS